MRNKEILFKIVSRLDSATCTQKKFTLSFKRSHRFDYNFEWERPVICYPHPRSDEMRYTLLDDIQTENNPKDFLINLAHELGHYIIHLANQIGTPNFETRRERIEQEIVAWHHAQILLEMTPFRAWKRFTRVRNYSIRTYGNQVAITLIKTKRRLWYSTACHERSKQFLTLFSEIL